MSEIDSAPSSASARFAGADALIALCGFGGVLAWSRWMPVEQRRRMTARELDGAYRSGLIAASAFVVAAVPHKFAAVVLVLGTAVLTYTTRLHPLWIFAVAPLLGWSA
jgi:hypothetical protein